MSTESLIDTRPGVRQYNERVPRYSKVEIKLRRAELEAWQTPDEMLERSRAMMDYMGSVELFSQPGVGFILEGWATAKFALARDADAVRLVSESERWPDFEMRMNGVVNPWEITEADEPDRRRGAEYRDATNRIAGEDSTITEDPVEDWIKRAEQAPGAIYARCQNKAKKHYGGRASLLVYLNLSEYGIRQKQIEENFADATMPAKSSFDEVWVLWNDHAYPVWKGGLRMDKGERPAQS